jgi:small conductance mechanosensitive channel
MLAGTLDVDVTSIIAMLSVAGLAVSMALQNTLSNLAGGLVLLVTKPFVVGDYVEADGISGTIAAVDMSYTAFVTPDNKQIFVPNSQLSATRITNFNRLGKRRMDLKFTASYDAPTAQVRAALQEALEAVPGIMGDPAPAIFLSEYQASSIEYLVRLWTLSGDYWDVYYALLEGVRDTFARHGVEMTYDHLNVHIVEK